MNKPPTKYSSRAGNAESDDTRGILLPCLRTPPPPGAGVHRCDMEGLVVPPPPSGGRTDPRCGCGTGVQIQDLADISSGTITAVDNHQQFLDTVTAWADGEGIGGRIRTVNASMDDLPFEDGQIDLIWSEGDISSVERTIPGRSKNQKSRISTNFGSDAFVRFPSTGEPEFEKTRL